MMVAQSMGAHCVSLKLTQLFKIVMKASEDNFYEGLVLHATPNKYTELICPKNIKIYLIYFSI